MNDADAVNLALLVFRVVVGVVMLAHGYRHIFGGGKIDGTAGWFESLGMKPGLVHAWVASLTEIAAGASLVLGLVTPLGAAGVIGTMTVALITNHLKNGFFIFYKGEGYEYVLTLIAAGIALAVIGAGEWSLDNALELWDGDAPGTTGLLLGPGLGGAGAAGLLAVFWRPPAGQE
ncbi:MAG TPA: DoxX family protein [Acidimicrobiales bacterium]|jgi:putative oxidoreductase